MQEFNTGQNFSLFRSMTLIEGALIEARHYQQEYELHRDWAKQYPDSFSSEISAEAAAKAGRVAKERRSFAKTLLQLEEKLAGYEFMTDGVTRRGAYNLTMTGTFRDWDAYERIFLNSKRGDTWV